MTFGKDSVSANKGPGFGGVPNVQNTLYASSSDGKNLTHR